MLGDGHSGAPSPGLVTACHVLGEGRDHPDALEVRTASRQRRADVPRLATVRRPRSLPIRDSVRFFRRVRSALTLFMVATLLGAAVAAMATIVLFLAGVAIGHAVG